MKIKLDSIKNDWKFLGEGDLSNDLDFLDALENIIQIDKIKNTHFRTPALTEYLVNSFIIQAEFDYIDNKTRVRKLSCS